MVGQSKTLGDYQQENYYDTTDFWIDGRQLGSQFLKINKDIFHSFR
jgi:hypothetical protein